MTMNDYQSSEKYRLLGTLLIERNLITPDQLDEALKMQEITKMPLGEILIQMGLVTEQEIIETLAKQLQIPFIDIASLGEINPEVIRLIPEDLARHHLVLAIGKNERVLTVVMADPINVVAIDDLHRITRLEIAPAVGRKGDIIEAIDKFYRKVTEGTGMEDMIRQFSEMRFELEKKGIQEEEQELDLNLLRVQADDPPVVRLVNSVIAQAISDRASDIHIEPCEDRVDIRYRVDGSLFQIITPPKTMHMAIVSRIKILSNLDIAERRLPQDGSFSIRLDHHEVDFRISTLPTIYGEKVVLRLLEKEVISRGDFRLETLGFETEQLEVFQKYIFRPYGMILLTGPTGSGKTTTLYTILNLIKSSIKNLVTVEDPVEYRLEGVQQVQARPEIGLTFAHALRSILRQDPDVIMVGEIRDLETAQMAVRSALTGHLVFSTLHTNDAVGTITRLINIGVEPFLVAESVTLCVAQRLVRKICSLCKESYTATRDVLTSLGLEEGSESAVLYWGRGCKMCRNTGYMGRTAIYEVLEMTPEIREMVLQNATVDLIKKRAIDHGMVTLRQSGIRKVLSGITTVEECLNVTIGQD